MDILFSDSAVTGYPICTAGCFISALILKAVPAALLMIAIRAGQRKRPEEWEVQT